MEYFTDMKRIDTSSERQQFSSAVSFSLSFSEGRHLDIIFTDDYQGQTECINRAGRSSTAAATLSEWTPTNVSGVV